MGTRELRVRDIVASPGEKVFGWLKVGENQDSLSVQLPIALVNGSSEGPVLYLQAALGGAQLNTIAVVREVVKKTRPEDLRGGIIAVLLVNYFGFHHDPPVNYSPKDGAYPLHLNRIFPGKPDGRSSERIAHQVFHEAVLKATHLIDVHQMGTMRAVNRVNVRVSEGEPDHGEAFEMARAFATDYILDEKEEGVGAEGRLAYQATVRGLPSIDPELAGSRGWDEDTIRIGVKGVQNVMRLLKMIDGQPKYPQRTLVASKIKTITANRGGFLEFKTKLGDQLKKGDTLAEVTTPFGEALETLKSPEEGIVWALPEFPMVSSGETVAILGIRVKTMTS